MRKLATIREISAIIPIENADKIEIAQVDGWKCVVKKDQFKVGESVMYFEIDSFLPIEPRFEFLRKSSYATMAHRDGFRLKTIRLRGQISQGLIMPLTDFPELMCAYGGDLTEALGIEVYEPPIPAELHGEVKGAMPSFLIKSDQPRIQNLSKELEEHRNELFEVTEKLDGTSMTVYWNNGQYGVCGRNYEFKDTTSNSLTREAEKLNLKEQLGNLGLNIALQGELIGEGIQGNPYKLHGTSFRVYNIIDIELREFMSPLNRYVILRKLTNVYDVPIIIGSCTMNWSIEEILEQAKGNSWLGDHPVREGLVFKSQTSQFSFKAINNDYL